MINKSISEVNHEAIRLLSEHLGVADAMRFINQFTVGRGNYTEERGKSIGALSLEEILKQIRSGAETPRGK
jgi:predicted transcriptional regulator